MFEIKKKKRNLNFISKIAKNDIIIGIPADGEEMSTLGLVNFGDTVVPSPAFGKECEINAVGFDYVDTSKPKENRYVCTVWTYPFGNRYANKVPIDQYRDCYPRVHVAPNEIELTMTSDDDGNRFIVALLPSGYTETIILSAINMFIEIFGRCCVFKNKVSMEYKKKKVNWEILPPGEKPSEHFSKMLKEQGKEIDTFDVERLSTIEKYKPKIIAEGVNGFMGYYAYVFDNCCILESAIYGNATYIVPADNWEVSSQKTKKELFDEKCIMAKIIHTEHWEKNLRARMKEAEGKTLPWWDF